ncbi:unnamed protein product [Cylindrotheca closterium]|uniref:Uncharacterized protein n=1 Tax=Cylindrotheca closterium TaxID=2856 RepID=A0AAD2G4T2_9STRA|nr:unnamed protein product [Cylindrotheca closterium]
MQASQHVNQTFGILAGIADTIFRESEHLIHFSEVKAGDVFRKFHGEVALQKVAMEMMHSMAFPKPFLPNQTVRLCEERLVAMIHCKFTLRKNLLRSENTSCGPDQDYDRRLKLASMESFYFASAGKLV